MTVVDAAARSLDSAADSWMPSTYCLRTSNGTGSGPDIEWKVEVHLEPVGVIKRRVWRGGEEWVPDQRDWCPEMVIWPTWSQDPNSAGRTAAALQGVQEYWRTAGERLRDSAKWMAAVLGAALAALVGTSPLAGMREHAPRPIAVVVGAAGLSLLVVTLFLILQVMRPQSVSYNEIQQSGDGEPVPATEGGSEPGTEPRRRVVERLRHTMNPLWRWKFVVESQQDLYLPCGVKCLTSLRQSMIIEEGTLMALSHARAEGDEATAIRHAQDARAARLAELRDAAARVATIGEFYRIQFRSTWATYRGLLFGLLGTAAVVAAFGWPHG